MDPSKPTTSRISQNLDDDVPHTPPPSYNEVMSSKTNVHRVYSEPPIPSAPDSFESSPDTQLEPLPEPQPEPQPSRVDRFNEPRLTPAANAMIQNYNNRNNPSNTSEYVPRFPQKDTPGGAQMIRDYNQKVSRVPKSTRRANVITQQPTQVIVVERQPPSTEDQLADCCCAVAMGCCAQLLVEVCCRALLSCGQ